MLILMHSVSSSKINSRTSLLIITLTWSNYFLFLSRPWFANQFRCSFAENTSLKHSVTQLSRVESGYLSNTAGWATLQIAMEWPTHTCQQKKGVVLLAIPCCRTVFWNIFTSVLRLFVELGSWFFENYLFWIFLFSCCSPVAKQLPFLVLFFSIWAVFNFFRSHFVRL